MSLKKCADKITLYIKQTERIKSSLHSLRRKHIHTHRHINAFKHKCFRHQIISFCAQTKEQKIEQQQQQNQIENKSDDDEEYEYEYEYDDESEEEEDAGNDNKEENENDTESEYEYEYETDDEEFEETKEQNAQIQEAKDSTSEISQNFSDFEAYSERVINELFLKLPENGRINGKPVEHFISPLILRPLEVFEDEIHNKFILMHNDMNDLFESAYKIPMENESELRDVIDSAFDKLNIYSSYIDNHFDLRHSPKHYLMRQIRVNHGKIIFLSMRKIMYSKYPQWAESDNWAMAEMDDAKPRSFIVSQNDNEQLIDNENDDQNIETIETEQE